MAEEDPPLSPPQGRGVVIPFLVSSRQSEAMRDLIIAYMEKILPPFGRQNDKKKGGRQNDRLCTQSFSFLRITVIICPSLTFSVSL